MTLILPPDEWRTHLRHHYLDEFIREGGAAVKFAVCYPGAEPGAVAARTSELAPEAGFLTASVSAATPKIQMIERIFGEVADEASQAVVDAIAAVPVGPGDRPLDDVVMTGVDIVEA